MVLGFNDGKDCIGYRKYCNVFNKIFDFGIHSRVNISVNDVLHRISTACMKKTPVAAGSPIQNILAAARFRLQNRYIAWPLRDFAAKS